MIEATRIFQQRFIAALFYIRENTGDCCVYRCIMCVLKGQQFF